ncbi:zinc/manganese transport system ATP-binding protein [Rhodospirillales bacterium URHD0017]|nr:zinc/manganese transport system ATP-binding protein [Rhodospirillales bacterium URHD0017]
MRDLTVGYRERVAVEGVSGVFAAGSLTAIVGANGAGKTTLLHAISGLVTPHRGSIEIAGAEIPADLAYLPQSDSIDRDFPISVLEFTALGGWARIGVLGRVPPELRLRAMSALQAVGLDDLAGRMLGELSVGQFRRALFARVIVQDAAIVLLDEPFAGVDAITSDDLLNLMQCWHADGRTVMVALHDLEQVLAIFPETLLLARKTIAWGATATVLTPEKLREAGLATSPAAGSRSRLAMDPGGKRST